MTTIRDITALIRLLKASFPNYNPADGVADVLLEFLKDIPIDTLKTATAACITEPGRQFAPSVGEIRGKVAEMRARAEGVPTTAEAWEELLKAPLDGAVYIGVDIGNGNQIQQMAYYKFSHPLVEKIARQLGWPGRFPGENIDVSRAHFFKAHEAARLQAVNQAIELPQITAAIDGIREIQEQSKRLNQ